MKYGLLLAALFFYNVCASQIPAGYYVPALGLSGATLKLALHNIIKGHTVIDYGSVDTCHPFTDVKPNGKVWDIYSYTFGASQPYEYIYNQDECGNYNSEGDCFNKEHTWPQSYFNQNTPMRSDLHHLFPTDGWVNNKRANFPYGEISSVSWTSMNGSKLGTGSSFTGYSGQLFEPLDSFKGDIARAYFYMTTRYLNEDAGWQNWEMANGADLTADAITLLMKWHHNDPVSIKEKDRNNVVFGFQKNRNPFIDYPEFADCIWGVGDCSTLSINENQKNYFSILPNPASQYVQIVQSSITSLAYQIKDMNGRVQLSGNSNNIDISQLSSGTYFISIVSPKGVATFKLIKN